MLDVVFVYKIVLLPISLCMTEKQALAKIVQAATAASTAVPFVPLRSKAKPKIRADMSARSIESGWNRQNNPKGVSV